MREKGLSTYSSIKGAYHIWGLTLVNEFELLDQSPKMGRTRRSITQLGIDMACLL